MLIVFTQENPVIWRREDMDTTTNTRLKSKVINLYKILVLTSLRICVWLLGSVYILGAIN